MRKGKIKYRISPDLMVDAEYEVANSELTIRLDLPCTLEYKCSYVQKKDDSCDRLYASYELAYLIEKILFVKKHKEAFEFVLSEYKKAEEQKELSSLDMIGYYHSLIEKHVSADLLPFWMDINILEDILKVLD